MAHTKWNCPEPIGFSKIDEQNAELDRLLRRLVGTLASDPGGALPEYRLAQLVEQTWEHFRTEEAFLQSVGYPELAAHQADHERIILKLRENLLRLEAPGAPPLTDLVEEFTGLTIAHLDTMDQAFIVWLQNR
jgi:hemerythrin-like metal-binding protein